MRLCFLSIRQIKPHESLRHHDQKRSLHFLYWFDGSAWASAFRENADQFYHLSEVQRLRGRLYAEPRLRERLNTYMQIAGKGGYLGQPFHAMGMRSAVKDFLRVAAGSRL